MSKAVVVLSGGLDSVVLAYYLKHQGYSLLPLAIDYGQLNKLEIEYAREHASKLGCRLQVANLRGLGSLLTSGLTSENLVPKDGTYADTVASTFVPNRNAIFISVAFGYAISHGVGTVAYGTHGGENGVSSLTPDCTPVFREALETALIIGNKGYLPPYSKLYAPFINKSKADIVTIGSRLGVEFHLTWSCYKNEFQHCGTCGACNERKKAFATAKVGDPTEYIA